MNTQFPPPTAQRVQMSTSEHTNERIRKKTIEDAMQYANKSKLQIENRIQELNREWDTERFLEAKASTLILISLVLVVFHSPYWLILTALVPAFLLMHAIQGWCPPLPLIRHFGFRTAEEIHQEKTALRIMAGEYEDLSDNPDAATRKTIQYS